MKRVMDNNIHIKSTILLEMEVSDMIMVSKGFVSKKRGEQSMHCTNCGKHLGDQGWKGDNKFNEIKEKGWEYCPYCGEALYPQK